MLTTSPGVMMMDFATGVAVVALSALGAALGTFLKEYFGSRGRKEGEIDALAANLQEVLRQLRETTRVAEVVKAAISGGLWVEQEKWKLKRDAYVSLLESIDVVASCLVEGRLAGGHAVEQARAFNAALARDQEEHPTRAVEAHRALLVARLFMAPQAFAALQELTRQVGASEDADWNSGEALNHLMQAHKHASEVLVAAAGQDLALTLGEHGGA
jgi:hypothetical protein